MQDPCNVIYEQAALFGFMSQSKGKAASGLLKTANPGVFGQNHGRTTMMDFRSDSASSSAQGA